MPVLHYAFAAILSVLVIASLTTAGLMRLHPGPHYLNVKLRIQTWWYLAGSLFLALTLGRAVTIAACALLSFLAFKEFLSITPTRISDRPVWLLAFAAIPLQYLWVALNWHDMALIFIPVYVFLLLPLRMVLIGDTQGFLRAAGSLQWGLMSCVFGLSHIALLLNLPQQAGGHGTVVGPMLVFYLLVLTQLNDVAQFLSGKLWGKTPVLPKVSPKKTVEGLIGGILVTTLLAFWLAPWLTPLSPSHALVSGVLISLSGFVGDVVMSALKRDVGIKDSGTLLPGHGGILDRVDSLTYTAPLFFHFLSSFHA